MLKWIVLTMGVFAVFFLGACGGGYSQEVASVPMPQSNESRVPTPGLAAPGQNGKYKQGYGVYQPLEVYVITGTVQAAPGSVQQYRMEGRFSGSSYNGYGSSSGYVSAGTDGKGIVRFLITSIAWQNVYVDTGVLKRDENWIPLAKIGDLVILKVEDTRGTQFVAGDSFTLICREQQEFVSAVAAEEIPTLANVSREFDGCRMKDGVVHPAPTPEG